jgi:hypothetical protein
MKHLFIALATAATAVGISLLASRLTSNQPKTDETMQSLQQRLAESERLIADLRQHVAAASPGAAGVESSPAQASEPASRPENQILAATQARLEAFAARLEERLTQLEKQLKSSHFLPLTREERDAEIAHAQKTLRDLQEEWDAQKAEVSRLAVALAVPEAVVQLSPWEAVRDPAYASYRDYFEAKMKESYLQQYVKDQAGKVFGLQLSCS